MYDRWQMLCTWLRRAALVLDRAFPTLPSGPIAFRVSFDEVVGETHGLVRPKTAEELHRLLVISAKPGCSDVQISVGKGFDDGFAQAENSAERALVEALVAGAASASGTDPDAEHLSRLINEICPNREARHIHRLQAQSFRDLFGSAPASKPVFAHAIDEAAVRIGLGWSVRSRECVPEISGVSDCTAYLAAVVTQVLDQLCGLLRGLDRKSFAIEALRSHEAAARDRDLWSRTALANVAIHDDKHKAIRTIIEHNSQLNACFVGSRILLEAAICECPFVGGRIPGTLDVSRAMALAMHAYHLGNWSDAIHWGAMEARLRITPLGDIQANQSLAVSIYGPFGQTIAEAQVKWASESYTDLYSQPAPVAPISAVIEARFLDAWAAEFGTSLEGMLEFLTKLEDAARNPLTEILTLPRSVLVGLFADAAGVSLVNAAEALQMFMSIPRPKWREVPAEFENKDWFPWRFHRRLSILRRPFVQIGTGEDPEVLCSPGLVRDAIFVGASSFHIGEVPSSQARSQEMRSWLGHANNVERTKFNSTVANRMKELEWCAEPEVKLTKLFGRPLDRNYGDIDVLAWRPNSGRVLAMECKDLQFHKTLGEVSKQLADFRGELRSDGKPDHLKRHLNRLAILEANKEEVARALKLTSPIELEGHLVFKNPVPMKFAWDKMKSKVSLSFFDELERL